MIDLIGGADGIRTRDPRRDRPRANPLFMRPTGQFWEYKMRQIPTVYTQLFFHKPTTFIALARRGREEEGNEFFPEGHRSYS